MNTRVRDARQLIKFKQTGRSNTPNKGKNNLSQYDARNHISFGAQPKANQQSGRGFDARQRIAGPVPSKRRKSNNGDASKSGNIVSLLSIDTSKKTKRSDHLEPPTSGIESSDVKKFGSLSKPMGFVCVTGDGQRTVRNKVTIGNTGLKIAVRNDAMTKKAKSSKPSGLNIKKTIQGLPAQAGYTHNLKQSSLKRSSNNSSSSSGMMSSRKRPYQEKPTRPHKSPMGSVQTMRPPPVRRKPSYEKRAHLDMEYDDEYEDDILRMLPKQYTDAIHQSYTDYGQSHEIEKKESRLMLPPSNNYINPFEGTKVVIANLHPRVIENDIQELFSAVGPVKRARMVGYGDAEVVFVRREDAVHAVRKYNNRDLDGQPMKLMLKQQGKDPLSGKWYSWMDEIGPRKKLSGSSSIDLEPNVLKRALFKSGSSGSPVRPVVFTVKV